MSPLTGPPVPGLNFTAVDFETANGFRGSPCSVGLVRVRDGVQTAWHYTRMRPPEGFDRFDPRNVAIHGITESQSHRERRFREVFAEMAEFIAGDPLVAHNAAFDVEVFQSALEVSGMGSPGLECFCSVRLSRHHQDLPSHALPKAAAAVGHPLREHHHALEDARAAAAVVCGIARSVQPVTGRGSLGLRPLFAEAGIEPERLTAWWGAPRRESRATAQVRPIAHLFDSRVTGVPLEALPDLMRWQDEGRNLPPSPEADSSHPLFGQALTFTGNLSVPRADAKKLAAQHGATTSSRVTAATTMLVVGDGFTPEDAAVGQTCPPLQSNKARDVAVRLARGQPIRMVSEDEFRSMLAEAWPVPSDPGLTGIAVIPPGEVTAPGW